MFDQIRLITKSNNQVEEPNSAWTLNTTIYCTCELGLGLGDKPIVWTNGNALPLSRLIEFYRSLSTFMFSSNDVHYFEFQYSQKSVLFEYIKEDSLIRVKLMYKEDERTTLLLEKYYPIELADKWKEAFYLKIIPVLIEKTNSDLCTKVNRQFYNDEEGVAYEFQVGQKVTTRPGENVTTQRTGYILKRFYHYKQKTTMYQLLYEGKKLEKRYRAADLESVNDDPN
jgi:hypothetical protein